MDHGIALQLVAVLALGTLLVALCQRFGLSPILGYLATGVLVGSAVLNWLPDTPATHLLAELGVVLLMFTIGLEFSLPRLLAAKRLVLGLGGTQVLATALVLGLAARWLGLSAVEAFVLGGALAMSSTAIVLKQLGEQMELPTPHGKMITAVLLFQDIAAVPMLVVLPILAADPSRLTAALALALGKAALVFIGLVFVGRRLLPRVLHWVAATRSLELFMLTALLLALSAAGVSTLAGLSPTLGAFMAGMLLGETLFRHQIEADIRPFRDLMLGLFFVTIGMQLDPATFVTAPGMVIAVLVALTIAKAVLLTPLARAFDASPVDARRTAIGLAQGGEFGLLVVSTALGLGLIHQALAQPVLGGLILSMVLAPLLLRFNASLARWPGSVRGAQTAPDAETRIREHSSEFDRHVIVCGYGRVGQNLVGILEQEGIPVLALDLDPERVRQAAAAGEPVLFGNATLPAILRAAGIERARALAVSIEDSAVAKEILCQLHGLGATLPVLVRSTRGRDDEALIEAGAEVFPEGLETSLAFAGQLLIMLDVPPSLVEARLNGIRAEDYAPLRVFFHDTAESGSAQEARDYPRQIRTVVIAEDHYGAGRTPHELQLEQQGVTLMGVRRGPIRVPGHLLDTRLRPGDVVLLQGDREALDLALSRLRDGP